MKKILYTITTFAIIFGLMTACSASKDQVVVFHTPYGDMKAILYEETPLHKENFIKLVESGQYDSTIFHRVIKDFMIQGGDVSTKPTQEEEPLKNYTIAAEINDQFYHVKGALAAARMGDNVNPERKSSGTQFYIVDGQTYEPSELENMAQGRMAQQKQMLIRKCLEMKKYASLRNEVIEMQKNQDMQGLMKFMDKADTLIAQEFGEIELYTFSEDQKEAYQSKGGAPHLDGEYTVFGRVVEGIGVIDSIAAVRTAQADKPVENIYIEVELEKVSKKTITKNYGYEYPQEEK